MNSAKVRNLVVVLGDQLDPDGAAFDGFDPDIDAVLMSEVHEEATYVPQHGQRLVLFFSGMRHLRDTLEKRGYTVLYGALDEEATTGTLAGELERRVKALRPDRVVVTDPGDFRVLTALLDWVSLPNVLGMSQYADGGVVGSKPYCASGSYINRMSDYCRDCRYVPGKATGDDACTMTTLYWDFLSRNRSRLEGNRRMGFQFKNLDRKNASERRDIKQRADALKVRFTSRTYL